MTMRPLYLNASEPLSVSLDGPALRVRKEGECSRLFPLERIARVTANDQVKWSTDALLACADAGIAICFLERNGSIRARLIGRATNRGQLPQLWSNFLDRPDHDVLYRQWRDDARRSAIGLCALRLGRDPAPLLAQPNAEIEAPAAEGEELRRFACRLKGLVEARTIEELGCLGLGADNAGLLPLVPDLATIVLWAVRADLAKWWTNDRCRVPKRTDPVVSFFERCRGSVDFQLRHTLRQLYRFLQELE